MASIGDVWLRLGLEGTQLEVDAKRQGARAGDAAGSAMSIGLKAKLSDVFKGGGIFGVGAALGASATGVLNRALSGTVGFFEDSITAASDLNETVSKSRVVFGDSATAVLAWGKTTATAIGLSQNQALAAAGTYGNLFVSMGLAGDQAATMSVRMVQLAGDLASFNNASPEDALAAIQSGLVGETEPLRKFGVNLNDAALRQKALDLGLTHSTKEVLPAAIRAQAAYALILEQSGTAQGDFARTSDGFANQQRIVAAEMADLSAVIGAELLPVFLSMERELVAIIPLFKDLVGLLAGPGTAATGAAADETDVLGSKTTLLGQAIHGTADAISLMGANLFDLADGGHRVEDMFAAWDAAAIKAGMAMTGTADHAGKAADDLVVVGKSLDTVGGKAGDMASSMVRASITSAEAMRNLRSNIVAAATGIIDGAYDAITTADSLAGTNAEINAQRRIIAMGGAASGTDRATTALDRQAKALDRASEAETKHTATLTAAIDKQIAQLDLSEKQLAIADRQRGLNEQLNAAQLDLAKAQKGGPGGVDAEAVSSALAKIQDIKEQQAENERQLGVDAQRDKLQAQKAEIEDKSRARQDELTKLKAGLDEQRQAVNTSGRASVADAKARLHELFKTQADEVLALALAGHMGSKEVADALVDMHNRLATATGEERIAILATIKALHDLETQAITTFLQFPSGAVVLRPVGAKGGPTLTDSGPSGPKPVVPGTRSTVVPPMNGFTNGKPIELLNILQIDGREVARSTSRYQAEDLNR